MVVFRRLAPVALALVAFGAWAPQSDAAPAAELANINADGYAVVVTDGSAKVGEKTHIVVTVKAKAGYKINGKYPFKLKLADPVDGVELPQKTLKKKDAELEGDKALIFRVPVTGKKAGTFAVTGKLKLSVCNENSCLIDKKQLKAKHTAK